MPTAFVYGISIIIGIVMALSKDQQEALDKFSAFLVHPTQVTMSIHGSPGRGKTFLTKEIRKEALAISSMQKLLTIKTSELNILNTATTNKAAEVFSHAINAPTSTIHSLLGIRPVLNVRTGKSRLIQKGTVKDLTNALVLIDEASGMCKPLKRMTIQSAYGSKLLMIGDKNQLTAVGSNYCCAFDDVDVSAELTTGQRFGTTSKIAEIGAQLENTIQTGEFKPIIGDGDTVIHIDGSQLETLVRQHFTKDLLNQNHAKIVCWGNPTVLMYNNAIRSLHTDSKVLEVGEHVISNTPVMNKNDILLYTEQECIVTAVSDLVTNMGVEGWMVTLNDNVEVFQPCEQFRVRLLKERLHADKCYDDYEFVKDSFADLRPLHASTAYKAQGSTYDVVFVDLEDIGRCHDWMTVARMLNVAISRAKNKVYLYGKLPAKYQDNTHIMPKKDVDDDAHNNKQRIPPVF